MNRVYQLGILLVILGLAYPGQVAQAGDEKLKKPAGKTPSEMVKGRPIKVLFCGNSHTGIGSGLHCLLYTSPSPRD